MRVVQKVSGTVTGVMRNCQILIVVLRFSQRVGVSAQIGC